MRKAERAEIDQALKTAWSQANLGNMDSAKRHIAAARRMLEVVN